MATGSETEKRGIAPASSVAPVDPTWAVVLLGGPSRSDLGAALTTGAPVCHSLGVGLKVLHTDESIGHEMATRFPSVSWLTVAAGTTEAERRAVGFAAAGTDIVVFARPRDMADAGWLAALTWRSGAGNGRRSDPSPEWAVRLAERGVPGALGDR